MSQPDSPKQERNYNITKDSDRVPIRQKIAYGMGTTNDLWGNWLYPGLSYTVFNQFLHVAPWLISVALMLNRLIDAVSDPIFGWMSDNTRTRFGRRRPYILIGSILAGLCLPCLFLVGTEWSQYGYFLFMVISSGIYITVVSSFNMPYQSLGAELTPDTHERTSVFSYKSAIQKIPEIALFAAGAFATSTIWMNTTVPHEKTLSLAVGDEAVPLMVMGERVGFNATYDNPLVSLENKDGTLSILLRGEPVSLSAGGETIPFELEEDMLPIMCEGEQITFSETGGVITLKSGDTKRLLTVPTVSAPLSLEMEDEKIPLSVGLDGENYPLMVVGDTLPITANVGGEAKPVMLNVGGKLVPLMAAEKTASMSVAGEDAYFWVDEDLELFVKLDEVKAPITIDHAGESVPLMVKNKTVSLDLAGDEIDIPVTDGETLRYTVDEDQEAPVLVNVSGAAVSLLIANKTVPLAAGDVPERLSTMSSLTVNWFGEFFASLFTFDFGNLKNLFQTPFGWPPSNEDMVPNVLLGAQVYTIILGCIMMIVGLIVFMVVRERYYSKLIASHKEDKKIKISETVYECLKCRPFRAQLAMSLSYGIGTSMVGTLGYYATVYYVCGGDISRGAIWNFGMGLSNTIIGAMGVFFYGFISKRIGKRYGMMAVQFSAIAIFIGTWWLYDPNIKWLQLLASGGISFTGAGFWTLYGSIGADVIDYDELESGKRREGAFSACGSWIMKVGMAIGAGCSGIILSATGFDAALGADQLPSAIFWIRFLLAAIPVIGLIIAFFALRRFGLDQDTMYDIRGQLEDRRGEV